MSNTKGLMGGPYAAGSGTVSNSPLQNVDTAGGKHFDPKIVTGPQMFVVMPSLQCPECGFHVSIHMLDSIRVAIDHEDQSNYTTTEYRCSRSNTRVIRPITDFHREI